MTWALPASGPPCHVLSPLASGRRNVACFVGGNGRVKVDAPQNCGLRCPDAAGKKHIDDMIKKVKSLDTRVKKRGEKMSLVVCVETCNVDVSAVVSGDSRHAVNV